MMNIKKLNSFAISFLKFSTLKVPEEATKKAVNYILSAYSNFLLQTIDNYLSLPDIQVPHPKSLNLLKALLKKQSISSDTPNHGLLIKIPPEDLPYPKLLPLNQLFFNIRFIPTKQQADSTNEGEWQGLWYEANLIKSKGFLGTIYLHRDIPSDLELILSWDDENNISNLKRIFFYLSNTTRHEVQHLIQSFIKFLSLTEEEQISGKSLGAGVSKKIRDQYYDPSGLSKDNEIQSHNLRDIEFQTNLSDNISDCNFILTKLPTQIHSTFIQAWINNLPISSLKSAIQKFIDANDLTDTQISFLSQAVNFLSNRNSFFIDLKFSQPLKYVKAVKDFIKFTN